MSDVRNYSTFDKSTWPRGQWDDEPDKVQWIDRDTGLDCLAVRSNATGSWCGYVGVAEGHPAFSKSYDHLDLAVHGGLTFADFCREDGDEASAICHVPQPGRPDRVWWLGFDCAHGGDLIPMPFMPRFGHATYRTLDYVRDECAKLAAQLQAMCSVESQLSENASGG